MPGHSIPRNSNVDTPGVDTVTKFLEMNVDLECGHSHTTESSCIRSALATLVLASRFTDDPLDLFTVTYAVVPGTTAYEIHLSQCSLLTKTAAQFSAVDNR